MKQFLFVFGKSKMIDAALLFTENDLGLFSAECCRKYIEEPVTEKKIGKYGVLLITFMY